MLLYRPHYTFVDALSNFIMAGVPGFEPELDDSKSSVLPLHHTPMRHADRNRTGIMQGCNLPPCLSATAWK